MSKVQYVVFTLISLATLPIVINVVLDWSKKPMYRAHMKHFFDLITVDTGNWKADQLRREILRISRRHSITMESMGWSEVYLRIETAKSLRRYATHVKVLAQRDGNPELKASAAATMNMARAKIRELRSPSHQCS